MSMMSEEEAIKIVKEFNKENRFRDFGRLNNAIDIIIRMVEEKNKIEKIKETASIDYSQNSKELIQAYQLIHVCENKINEIIEYINKENTNE